MGNYLKSAHYADQALGELFEYLKEEDLLKDTIFILYGDHEARLAKNQFDLLYTILPDCEEKTNTIMKIIISKYKEITDNNCRAILCDYVLKDN